MRYVSTVRVNNCRHMDRLQQEFLGVKVHWIDSETLQWKKAAIACRRFRGRHTYDAIASELEDIFSQYGLTTEKVTACVTDNGGNFVKAFKEYQQVETEEDEEEEDDGKVAFTNLHSILTGGDDEDAQQGLCVHTQPHCKPRIRGCLPQFHS